MKSSSWLASAHPIKHCTRHKLREGCLSATGFDLEIASVLSHNLSSWWCWVPERSDRIYIQNSSADSKCPSSEGYEGKKLFYDSWDLFHLHMQKNTLHKPWHKSSSFWAVSSFSPICMFCFSAASQIHSKALGMYKRNSLEPNELRTGKKHRKSCACQSSVHARQPSQCCLEGNVVSCNERWG